MWINYELDRFFIILITVGCAYQWCSVYVRFSVCIVYGLLDLKNDFSSYFAFSFGHMFEAYTTFILDLGNFLSFARIMFRKDWTFE